MPNLVKPDVLAMLVCDQIITDRLTGKVTQRIDIPENAIPDASKILVRIYPGVFSQVLEGTEGMLRLPGG